MKTLIVSFYHFSSALSFDTSSGHSLHFQELYRTLKQKEEYLYHARDGIIGGAYQSLSSHNFITLRENL